MGRKFVVNATTREAKRGDGKAVVSRSLVEVLAEQVLVVGDTVEEFGVGRSARSSSWGTDAIGKRDRGRGRSIVVDLREAAVIRPIVQTALMREILVSLPSGAGVVRLDDGSMVITNEVSEGGGTYLREADTFHPAKSWVDEDRCVVGGLLPPGAISVEAVDDQGTRVAATVAQGAYAAVLEQANDGHEPIVCCRDVACGPVRRPWADDYPSVRVTDAEEPCPACGSIDYDEYTPFEKWRGGRGGPNGATVPNPVVSCRVCGHEETEGTFFGVSSEASKSDDEATPAARTAPTRARHPKHGSPSAAITIRETRFPIYGAQGWPARLGGSGSQGGKVTNITIYHYNVAEADPYAGDRPRLAITTKRDELHSGETMREARRALENWLSQGAGAAGWPEASRAAIALWLRARDRERRAAVLGASRSEQLITIDGAPTRTLTLNGPGNRWVAVARHADLMIIVAAHDLEPTSLRLESIADPAAQLLGPEPPDA